MAQEDGWRITILIYGGQPALLMALSGEFGAKVADGRASIFGNIIYILAIKHFLTSVYPVLKGAPLFYVDFLIEHPTYHWLVINPDESPENAPKAHQGSSLDAGATMTQPDCF